MTGVDGRTGLDNRRAIDQAPEATRSFTPPGEPQVAAVLNQDGEYELFKTSAPFGGPPRNAEWLGEDAAYVKKPAPSRAG